MEVREIPLEDIYPNPWNPNMTSARVDDAIRESIGTYGFVQPLIVRPHPQETGKYQIIDGEHRFEAAGDLGFKTIPAVIIEISDIKAKKLTIIANETRGRAEVISLAGLLEEIQLIEEDDALVGLPYREADLEEILARAERIAEAELKTTEMYSRIVLKYPPMGHGEFIHNLRTWLREKYPEVILVS